MIKLSTDRYHTLYKLRIKSTDIISKNTLIYTVLDGDDNLIDLPVQCRGGNWAIIRARDTNSLYYSPDVVWHHKAKYGRVCTETFGSSTFGILYHPKKIVLDGLAVRYAIKKELLGLGFGGNDNPFDFGIIGSRNLIVDSREDAIIALLSAK